MQSNTRMETDKKANLWEELPKYIGVESVVYYSKSGNCSTLLTLKNWTQFAAFVSAIENSYIKLFFNIKKDWIIYWKITLFLLLLSFFISLYSRFSGDKYKNILVLVYCFLLREEGVLEMLPRENAGVEGLKINKKTKLIKLKGYFIVLEGLTLTNSSVLDKRAGKFSIRTLIAVEISLMVFPHNPFIKAEMSYIL